MQTKKKVFALVSRVYISSITQSMEKVANFLVEAGHTVVYESETASNISAFMLSRLSDQGHGVGNDR